MNSLENIAVGDKVIISERNGYTVGVVSNVTKTMFDVGNRRYVKNTGFERTSNKWHATTAYHPGEVGYGGQTAQQRYDQWFAENGEKLRRAALFKFIEANVRKADTTQLDAIAKLLGYVEE